MNRTKTMAAFGAAMMLACSPPRQQEIDLGQHAYPVFQVSEKAQGSVWDAIAAEHPEWLDGTRDVTAYVVMRCTEVTCLRWIETDLVERVRFEPAAGGGSIAVHLKTRERSEGTRMASGQPLAK
jgi:hypothetical protein